MKRRHRNDPEVSSVAGADWAKRKPPQNLLVKATAAENAVANELDQVWLHPTGSSPYSGAASALFPWTIAKAFLSSPAALRQTISERRRRITAHPTTPDQQVEIEALDRLNELNDAVFDSSAKYDELVRYLRSIGIDRRSSERVVVFAERVATLCWLRDRLRGDLCLAEDQIAVLHGGLSDTEQQQIVESFKQSNSPIRVLVTGDVASEGVNLHQQCHELIHFDIPWSLIRIEQRNGRIDRYGQRHSPQITTLLLEPSNPVFRGDLRVLSRLLKREQEAHEALGDAGSLMGRYSASAEEEDIKLVLAGRRDFNDVVRSVDELSPEDSLACLLASLNAPTDDKLRRPSSPSRARCTPGPSTSCVKHWRPTTPRRRQPRRIPVAVAASRGGTTVTASSSSFRLRTCGNAWRCYRRAICRTATCLSGSRWPLTRQSLRRSLSGPSPTIPTVPGPRPIT